MFDDGGEAVVLDVRRFEGRSGEPTWPKAEGSLSVGFEVFAADRAAHIALYREGDEE